MTDESGVILPGSREEMRFLRKNSNWVNMIIAILACLGVVAVVLLIAPQPDVDPERVVDYQAVAEQAQQNAEFDLVVPQIPRGWTSNEASLERNGDSEYISWYVSFIGEDEQWVSIEQAKASELWAENQAEEAVSAETVEAGGATFQIYRAEDGKEYWIASDSGVWVVITAIANPGTTTDFATQVGAELTQ